MESLKENMLTSVAMHCIMYGRASVHRNASQKSTFTDYKDWVFYADAVAWAESKGIIKDNGDHKFRPDDAVTRVELAKFIYYAYK